MGAGQEFHPAHSGQVQGAEVELRAGGGIVHGHAIEQHQEMVCLGAAQPRLRDGAAIAGRREREPGQRPQRVGAVEYG